MIEIQGDVIEIVLAALRGHDIFMEVLLPLVQEHNTTLITVNGSMSCLLKALHQVQGFMVTGRIAYRGSVVPLLKFCGDEQGKHAWTAFKVMLDTSAEVGLASLIKELPLA